MLFHDKWQLKQAKLTHLTWPENTQHLDNHDLQFNPMYTLAV